MKLSIFKKAHAIAPLVVNDGEATFKGFFTFKDMSNPPKITITHTKSGTSLESCTCKHHSIHGGLKMESLLCAYVLAVYIALPNVPDKPEPQEYLPDHVSPYSQEAIFGDKKNE